MADEITDKTLAELAAADKPPAPLVEAEKKIDPPVPEPQPDAEPMSAVDRLRAFEDAKFGEKAVRINGRVERGFGSPYQKATPATRKAHAALENLIDVEAKLAAAHSALIAADTEHEAAQKAADDAEQEANAAAND